MNDTEFIIDLPEELFDTKLPNSYNLKYYRDLGNRIIWINEEINNDLTYELVHYITKWNREDKDIPEVDRKPIRLLFDSPGGDLDA
jgi:ATP-dependent protease ClpP protease subunit